MNNQCYKVNIESIFNSKDIALTNDHDSSQSNVFIIKKCRLKTEQKIISQTVIMCNISLHVIY